MEPEIPQPNYKTMAAVLWIALITAIVVTIIDWKIKSDILRLTDAFYRVYPTTLENQHHGTQNGTQSATGNPGRIRTSDVLRFPVVDSHSRVEAENATVVPGKDAEDHSDAWAKFAPEVDTGLKSGTAEDSGQVQA